MIKITVNSGVDPITAIRIASINTARHYGLRSMGAIAPGYKADMVVTDDLNEFYPEMVFKDGKIVARHGVCIAEFPPSLVKLDSVESTVSCPFFDKSDFMMHLKCKKIKARAIRIFGDSVTTEEQIIETIVKNGEPDLSGNDLTKICAVNRYSKEKQFSMGFVTGLGIKKGAIALSVGHDSHNLSVTGKSERNMEVALNVVIKANGGMAVAVDGELKAILPLPVAGLMSDLKLVDVLIKSKEIKKAAAEIGSKIDNPFMALSFVQLEVIPKLKITNKGLFDVTAFSFVEPFEIVD